MCDSPLETWEMSPIEFFVAPTTATTVEHIKSALYSKGGMTGHAFLGHKSLGLRVVVGGVRRPPAVEVAGDARP